MGVSSDTTDLTLLVSGGEAFAKRITELKAAKDSFDKSLEELNLGKAARAAHDEAGRVLSEAKAKRDADMAALDAELTNARNGLNIWVSETKAEITASYNEAKAKSAAAAADQEAATAAKNTAYKVLADAKMQAASLVKDAEAAAADIVDRATKEASSIVARAKKVEEDARKALAVAEDTKSKYDTALDRIKAAMVSA